MTIGIGPKGDLSELGSASFVTAFFSTIAANLEPDGWGSRFPTIMKRLYAGRLDAAQIGKALKELATIKLELAGLPPNRVVWDYKDRSAAPPWGDNISPHITSVRNYFVTSAGEDLIDTVEARLVHANSVGEAVVIDSV